MHLKYFYAWQKSRLITHPDISPSTDELSAYGHIVGLGFFKETEV